ncbi:hypothetical protein NE237_006031 [Protea cynaroides]|uniref:Uncharacterized protein n=1 Tax=Protea cynaroides TaxID=273540 RepID=A0A9Q0KLR7_9MAGN|nr:hypothetical protein NE237_006031 [Protea cynaroides]
MQVEVHQISRRLPINNISSVNSVPGNLAASIRVPSGVRIASDIPRVSNGGQGGSHGSAMAMVNAGLRVATGIRAVMNNDPVGLSNVLAMSFSGGDDAAATKTSLSLVNFNSVRRASDGSLWVPMREGMIDRLMEESAGNARGNSGLERPMDDLGNFLGFPSLETESVIKENKSKDSQEGPIRLVLMAGIALEERSGVGWIEIKGRDLLMLGFPSHTVFKVLEGLWVIIIQIQELQWGVLILDLLWEIGVLRLFSLE